MSKLVKEIKDTDAKGEPSLSSSKLFKSRPEELENTREQLCEAVQIGDVAQVESCLDAGFSVEELEKSSSISTSPLILSLSAPSSAVYSRLRNAGFGIPLVMDKGQYNILQWMALSASWTSAEKKPEMTRMEAEFPVFKIPHIFMEATWGEINIEESKKQLYARDAQGNNVLTYACANNHLQQVQELVQFDNELIHNLNQFNEAPINLAVNLGHTEIVIYLYSVGAMLGFGNTNGRYAICCAVANGRNETWKFLLAKDIFDIDFKGKNGQTPYIVAAQYGRLDVLKELRHRFGERLDEQRDKEGRNALLKAAEYGKTMVVEWLVDTIKVDVSVKDKRGFSVFVLAVISGCFKLVNWLLSKAVDINLAVVGDSRTRPIHYAAKYGHLRILRLLIERDAENLQSKDDLTALHYAAEEGQLDAVRFLIEMGFSKISEKDTEDCDVIDHSIQGHSLKVMQYIFSDCLKDKEEKEIERYKGKALLQAADCGALEIVRYLRLELHAPLIAHKDGMTAFLLAAQNGFSEIVRFLLIEGGANIGDKNKKKQTAFNLTESEDVHAILKKCKENQRIITSYREKIEQLRETRRQIDRLILKCSNKKDFISRLKEKEKAYELALKIKSDLNQLDRVSDSDIISDLQRSFSSFSKDLFALKKEIEDHIYISNKKPVKKEKDKKPESEVIKTDVPSSSAPILVSVETPIASNRNNELTDISGKNNKLTEDKRKEVVFLFEGCFRIFEEAATLFSRYREQIQSEQIQEQLTQISKNFTRTLSDSKDVDLRGFSINLDQSQLSEEIINLKEKFESHVKRLDFEKLDLLRRELEFIRKTWNAEYGKIKDFEKNNKKREENKVSKQKNQKRETARNESKSAVPDTKKHNESKPFVKKKSPVPSQTQPSPIADNEKKPVAPVAEITTESPVSEIKASHLPALTQLPPIVDNENEPVSPAAKITDDLPEPIESSPIADNKCKENNGSHFSFFGEFNVVLAKLNLGKSMDVETKPHVNPSVLTCNLWATSHNNPITEVHKRCPGSAGTQPELQKADSIPGASTSSSLEGSRGL